VGDTLRYRLDFVVPERHDIAGCHEASVRRPEVIRVPDKRPSVKNHLLGGEIKDLIRAVLEVHP
jgi:hypothetical protein